MDVFIAFTFDVIFGCLNMRERKDYSKSHRRRNNSINYVKKENGRTEAHRNNSEQYCFKLFKKTNNKRNNVNASCNFIKISHKAIFVNIAALSLISILGFIAYRLIYNRHSGLNITNKEQYPELFVGCSDFTLMQGSVSNALNILIGDLHTRRQDTISCLNAILTSISIQQILHEGFTKDSLENDTAEPDFSLLLGYEHCKKNKCLSWDNREAYKAELQHFTSMFPLIVIDDFCNFIFNHNLYNNAAFYTSLAVLKPEVFMLIIGISPVMINNPQRINVLEMVKDAFLIWPQDKVLHDERCAENKMKKNENHESLVKFSLLRDISLWRAITDQQPFRRIFVAGKMHVENILEKYSENPELGTDTAVFFHKP